MRIVVIGAGKLGYSVAQLLADDQHDVVVVEKNEARRNVIKNNLDVLTIGGNGSSLALMEDPAIKNADILFASTDSDEVNMIACMLAKRANIKHTVARIRDTEYAKTESAFLKDVLKIDMVLNPEQITAHEINRILMTPAALDVEDFAEGKVRMFEAKLREDSEFVNKKLKELDLPKQILAGLIFRNRKMIIPNGDDVLEVDDNIFFIGKLKPVKEFENKFAATHSKVNRVMIIGAGRTGRFLALMLEKQGFVVKIIDKNLERSKLIASQLENGLALYGDATEIDFLTEEGISETDVVICLTEDDKLNLMIALLAKHLGADRTIVRVSRNEYVDLMEKVGVDLVLSSRLLSSAEVLKFVRRGGVVSVSLLEGAKAEALEFILSNKSKIIGKKLLQLELPKECLICAVVHKDEAFVPDGNTILYEGDRVIIFVKNKHVKEVMSIVEGRSE